MQFSNWEFIKDLKFDLRVSQSGSKNIKCNLHLQFGVVLKHFKSCLSKGPWGRSPRNQ